MIKLATILNDLLGAGIVIAALIAAAVIIKLIASAVAKAKNNVSGQDKIVQEHEALHVDSNAIAGAGLMLTDVDEKTAALVMAIISHESEIPLCELIFRSIKLV